MIKLLKKYSFKSINAVEIISEIVMITDNCDRPLVNWNSLSHIFVLPRDNNYSYWNEIKKKINLNRYLLNVIFILSTTIKKIILYFQIFRKIYIIQMYIHTKWI